MTTAARRHIRRAQARARHDGQTTRAEISWIGRHAWPSWPPCARSSRPRRRRASRLATDRIGLIRAGNLFRAGTLEELREVRVPSDGANVPPLVPAHARGARRDRPGGQLGPAMQPRSAPRGPPVRRSWSGPAPGRTEARLQGLATGRPRSTVSVLGGSARVSAHRDEPLGCRSGGAHGDRPLRMHERLGRARALSERCGSSRRSTTRTTCEHSSRGTASTCRLRPLWWRCRLSSSRSRAGHSSGATTRRRSGGADVVPRWGDPSAHSEPCFEPPGVLGCSRVGSVCSPGAPGLRDTRRSSHRSSPR